MFKKIKNILKKLFPSDTSKQRRIIMLSIALFMFMPDLAHAANASSEVETYREIGSLLNIALGLLQSLMWPFLIFIGDLMDVDLITGPGMEERLWAIWVQIRDLVNICFVIYLLVIALTNTLGIGGGEGNLAMKTALPKLVIGLIIVNFTFVAGKVVIDVSNVATTAVFALPELVDTFDMSDQRDSLAKNLCVPESGGYYSYDDENTPVFTRIFCETDEDETKYIEKLSLKSETEYFASMNKSNIALVMAVNMGAVNSQNLLKANAINNLGDLIENFSLSVLMTLVMVIAYITLGLVLLARVVVLWLVLAFSPIGVLIFVIPQVKEWLGGGGDVVQKIVKHLLAPVIIGVAMTVGYVMIDAYDGIVGNSSSSVGGASGGAIIFDNVLFSGVSDISQLLISVASVVVVWVGVFGAASDTLAGFATNAIKGLGETAGKGLAKLPLQAAGMPVPVFDQDTGNISKERISVLDMFQAGKNRFDNFRYGQDEAQNEKIGKVFGSKFQRNFTNANADDKLTRLRTQMQGKDSLSDSDLQAIISEFSDIARNNKVKNQGALISELRQKVDEVKSTKNVASLASWIKNNEDKFEMDDDAKQASRRFREEVLNRSTYQADEDGVVAAPQAPAPAPAQESPQAQAPAQESPSAPAQESPQAPAQESPQAPEDGDENEDNNN